MRRSRVIGLVTAVSLVAAACSVGEAATPVATTAPPETTATTSDAAPTAAIAPESATATPATAVTNDAFQAAGFDVSAGTEQLTITGAEPGRSLTTFGPDGAEVASGAVDERGALVVRLLDGGTPHVVGDDVERTEPVVTLARDEHPDAAFYAEQRLPTDGLGYITTRDGTTLSGSVWLPGPPEDGPYPTVVEYSGYAPSDPDSAGLPDVWTALGYAYVGVNIRGTGCSGGSFRFFEYTQSLDGYDVIETVAAQPWVQGNGVGMVGVSYAGISQLFVAQTQPPSLLAITPFSAIADTATSTLYPGGILNTGFAVPWAAERQRDATPEGQAWTVDRIAAGDEVCETNQDLRLQNPDLLALIDTNQFWTDEVASEISPREFVDLVEVPTFVAGAWQDEQTGGHFATLLDGFTGTDHVYASVMNGLHTDSIGPAVFPRLVEFLDLYVAERTPSLAVARFVAPLLSQQLFGTSDVALPTEDRFAGMSHAEALAAFEAEPPIRVLFEEGAADGFPARSPLPRFEAAFDSWPVPGADARSWYLTADGSLTSAPSDDTDESSYLALPDATPPTWFDGSAGNIWSVDVTYDWREGGAGTFADWMTEPLADDTVIVGSGSVDLWIRSDFQTGPAADTDVEVTIAEIRPDGQELYIQSGWLRASHRALDEGSSTELRPVQTHREADAEPLPGGVFELIRVELFPFAHAFRAGSRIRLIVDAPGGQRPVWEFRTISGGEEVTIAHGGEYPSRIVLPVVDGVDVPEGLPACDSLRGQPCRQYAN